jgi:hypothetical protein
VPEPYPIRAWGKLPLEDVEMYRHTLDRLTALLAEAETDRDTGLLKGDPNNSRLDLVANRSRSSRNSPSRNCFRNRSCWR